MFKLPERPGSRIGFGLLALASLLGVAIVGWWWLQCESIEQQRLALADIERLQQKLTEPQWNWIDSPVTTQTQKLPWWVATSAKSTFENVRGISFDLRSYDDALEEPTEISNEHLQLLTAFPELRSLKIPRSKIDDEGLVHLASLNQLEVLDLSDTAITDDGLRHLARLPRLQTLVLDGIQIDGSGLVHLASNRQLADLSLRGVPLENATFINAIPSLEQVVISSDMLQHVEVTDHPNLHSLTMHLAAAKIRLQLARLPRLRTTSLSLTAEESLEGLSCVDLPTLQRLELRVDAAGADDQTRLELRELPRLEQLTISASRLADDFARQLSHVPNVTNLEISGDGTDLGDDVFQALSQLPRLRQLRLHGVPMTDAGVRELATSELLEVLFLESEQISDSGIGELAALPKLRTLGITGSGGDVDPGPTLSKFPCLERLHLGDCRFPALTLSRTRDSQEPSLARLVSLTVTSDTMQTVTVEHLPSLEDLSLDASAASGIHIRSLPALSRLDISLKPDQVVRRFSLERLPRLSWLSLQCGPQGARVPAETFENFHTFGRLRNGIIWGLEMPDAAREDLRGLNETRGVRF